MRDTLRKKRRKQVASRVIQLFLFVVIGFTLLLSIVYVLDALSGNYDAIDNALVSFLIASVLALGKIVIFEEEHEYP